MSPEQKDRSTETVSRPTRGAAIATVVVAAVVIVHMFFTLVYNMPFQKAREALPTAAAVEYMQPFFTQDYKIFAPNPVSGDHQLWVRALVEAEDGTRTETEWTNATAIELGNDARRLLRKHLSVVTSERLLAAYRNLNAAQQKIVQANLHASRVDEYREELRAAATGGVATSANTFLRYARAADAYSTQVARALWSEDGRIVAVQTRPTFDRLVRWDDRFDPEQPRPAARIATIGWRPTLTFEGQDGDAFTDIFRNWNENLND